MVDRQLQQLPNVHPGPETLKVEFEQLLLQSLTSYQSFVIHLLTVVELPAKAQLGKGHWYCGTNP